MRSTGSTSAKWGPDDPADGLHPVLHVPLGAGHEQERLGVGRHLLPLPGTTCKTGRHRLTARTPCGQRGTRPQHGPPPRQLACSVRRPPLPNLSAMAKPLVPFWQPPPTRGHSVPTSHGCLWGPSSFPPSSISASKQKSLEASPGAIRKIAFALEANWEKLRTQSSLAMCSVLNQFYP